jgi:hypothetical protein
LDDIHGVIAIASHADGDREHLTMIAVEQLSEPLRIPSQGPLDELPVVVSQITTSCLTATGQVKFRLRTTGYGLREKTPQRLSRSL